MSPNLPDFWDRFVILGIILYSNSLLFMLLTVTDKLPVHSAVRNNNYNLIIAPALQVVAFLPVNDTNPLP